MWIFREIKMNFVFKMMNFVLNTYELWCVEQPTRMGAPLVALPSSLKHIPGNHVVVGIA